MKDHNLENFSSRWIWFIPLNQTVSSILYMRAAFHIGLQIEERIEEQWPKSVSSRIIAYYSFPIQIWQCAFWCFLRLNVFAFQNVNIKCIACYILCEVESSLLSHRRRHSHTHTHTYSHFDAITLALSTWSQNPFHFTCLKQQQKSIFCIKHVTYKKLDSWK